MITPDINANLSRRRLLITGGAAGLGALTLGTTGCPSKKSVDFWVETLSATLDEFKTLLPNQATLISRVSAALKSFNDAFQSDKFDTAISALTNVSQTIEEIVTAAGINLSDRVKLAFAGARIAVKGIAVLLSESKTEPQVAAALKEKSKASIESAKQVSLIELLASPSSVQAIFEASKP